MKQYLRGIYYNINYNTQDPKQANYFIKKCTFQGVATLQEWIAL